MQSLKDAAGIEAGIKKMMVAGNFKGFTDTFEDLHGLKQLPGIASQRLMHDRLWICRRRRLENSALGAGHENNGIGLDGW